MLCPRCQQPTTDGAACAQCAATLDTLFGPVPPPAGESPYRQPAPPAAGTLAPRDPSDPSDPSANTLGESLRRESAVPSSNLLVGALSLGLGLVLTLLSYRGAFGPGSGRYTVFTGLIAVGGYRLFRGLVMRD